MRCPSPPAARIVTGVNWRKSSAYPGTTAARIADYEVGLPPQATNAPLVLCHGDPTIGNVILSDADGKLYLIDWDGVILAPKERDLAHFGGKERDYVLRGYSEVAGTTTLNETILEFYSHQWNIGEIADFGGRILFETPSDEQNAHDVAEVKLFLDYSGLG
jgi:aminoglycoside phosphotransferase (APT) family kinase protein